jgi:hypothetical protein
VGEISKVNSYTGKNSGGYNLGYLNANTRMMSNEMEHSETDGEEEKRISVADDCVMLGQCYERHDAACCTDLPNSFST